MNQVRVTHVLGAGSSGGAEAFFLRLVTAMHGHKQVTQTIVVRANSWASQQLTAAGIPHHTLPFGGLLDLLLGTTRRRLRQLCQSTQAQVVVAFMNRAAMHTPTGPWTNVGRLGGYYKLKYYKPRITHLICNTQDLVTYCTTNGWPASHVHYLPNFIPTPPTGWRKQGAQVRASLSIPPTATVALLAARLHPVKGHATALQALATLPKSYHLICAGDGPLKAELQALATQLGVASQVHWVGWINDITPFAAASNLWLVPSSHEPLGNSVLDAWAHQLPVVATSSTGPAALIQHGTSGLLTPIADAKLFAQAWRQATQPSMTKELVAGGTTTFTQQFSQATVVAQYCQYYQSLTKKA